VKGCQIWWRLQVQSERVRVRSFEGLYDEEALGRCFDINERRHCWFGSHEWVNAGLEWSKTTWRSPDRTFSEGFYTELQSRWSGSDDEQLPYGNVRLCRKCKLVDCCHQWAGQTAYELAYDAYYSEVLTVAECHRCRLKVAMGKSGECHPTKEAQDLINEVIKEVFPTLFPREDDGREGPSAGTEGDSAVPPYGFTACYTATGTTLPPGGPYLGSGFYVELPVLVSRILATLGREDAVAYIKACIKDGIPGYVTLRAFAVPSPEGQEGGGGAEGQEEACSDVATGR